MSDDVAEEIEELRRAVNSAGIAKVAKASGVKFNTLQDFAKGDTYQLRNDNLARVRQGVQKLRKNVSPGELENLPVAMRGHGGVSLIGEAYTMIPVYDLAASAGPGSLVEDGEPLAYEAFRAGELRRITKADYENLSIIRVSGESMLPLLVPGDRVLVDRSVVRVKRDGIYVVQIDDELMIKRAGVDVDTGNVILRSANPDYPPMTITRLDRLRVVGRGVWLARQLE